ncbi:UNVERIFIED_CONTAM: putative aspartic proteinase GIP2 [Sesamum latifolium]|uniref:Aspartic proteinase GIP2 n=1 Tax=Sesamum latifolium TaxID=2727402 RepID=A0AAW2XTG7_9LAMI
MASFLSSLLFLVVLISATNAQTTPTLPIRKDPKTSQFYTTIQMGSNLAAIKAVIDLGGPFLWFACNDYASNTYAPIPCGSTKCYAEDTLYMRDRLSVPDFSFSCMDKDFLEGLASGATGMLGLARTDISFHKQAANRFNLPDKFSLCPPSSGIGKLTVGDSPFSGSLKTTPLIINPVSTYPIYVTGEPSDEYFIDVRSIRVDGKPLAVKNSYFSIDENGVGGTKISTIRNFTALHNSIYKPFTRAFLKAAADMKIKSIAAVPPFRACFSSDSISRTPAGPSAPVIDLVLPGNDVYWRINGGNSLVEIDQKTTCLAFVDGGSNPRTSIVIGAHQLEENFLEFDLLSSQLRFSSSLLVQNNSCSRL